MKTIFLFLLSCLLLTGCCDDDKKTSSQPVAIGNFSMTYNGEDLEFKDIKITEGGPDSEHDLKMHSVILFDDVPQTKHSLVLAFHKNEEEEFHLDNITFATTERVSEASFSTKSFYAYTSGEFMVDDFKHTTLTFDHTDKLAVNGSFNGMLLPYNTASEPIYIYDGTFASVFTPEDL